MKVFCPNCGQANEAAPGSRVMCTACTAVFDAPGEAAPPPPPPPPPGPAPGAWQQATRPPGAPAPIAQAAPVAAAGQKTNPLAIVSLVLGILCCLPFSIGAIITGLIAMKQIDADPTQTGKGLAIAGTVLGGLGILIGLLSIVANLVK